MQDCTFSRVVTLRPASATMDFKIVGGLLVFVAALEFTNAGVVTLQPYEQTRILQQFDELCASGRVPETGQLVNLAGQQTWVYCKKEPGQHQKRLQHRVKYEGPVQYPQTVFIKPADWYINSDVVVDAILKSAGVNINVVPPKINSDVSVTVRPDIQPPQKPRVAFLQGSKDITGSNFEQTSISTGYGQSFGNPPPARLEQNLDNFAAPTAQFPVVQQKQRQISEALTLPQQQVQATTSQENVSQQRTQRQVEAVPVTWGFLMNELRKNRNNKNAMYYVIKRRN